MTPLNFLRTSNYRPCNHFVAQKTGSITASLFFCELVDQLEFKKREHPYKVIQEDGKEWIEYTFEDGEERLLMKRREQESAISCIEEYGLVEKKLMGLPAKRYFSINEKKTLEMFGLSKKDCQFVQNEQTSLYENAKQDCTKRTNSPIYTSLNNKPKKEKKQKNAPSAEASALSEFLHFEITQKKKNFTKGEIPQSWIKKAEELIKLRSLKQLKEVIKYALGNEFWFSKTLSMDKVHKHLDTLEIQMKQIQDKRVEKHASFLQEVKNRCFFEKNTSDNLYYDITIVDLNLSDDKYIEQIINNMKDRGMSMEGLENQKPDSRPEWLRRKEDDKQLIAKFVSKFGNRGLSDGQRSVTALYDRFEFVFNLNTPHIKEKMVIGETGFRGQVLDRLKTWGIDIQGL